MKMHSIGQPYLTKTRQVPTNQPDRWKTLTNQKHRQKKRRELACRIFGPHRTKHLRRRENNFQDYEVFSAAIADEPERTSFATEQHTPRSLRGVRVLQRNSRHAKFMWKSKFDFAFQNSIPNENKKAGIDLEFVRLTAGVTLWWAGRGNVVLTEPAPSHANCPKTRRLPPVGCTLCWAALVQE